MRKKREQQSIDGGLQLWNPFFILHFFTTQKLKIKVWIAQLFPHLSSAEIHFFTHYYRTIEFKVGKDLQDHHVQPLT